MLHFRGTLLGSGDERVKPPLLLLRGGLASDRSPTVAVDLRLVVGLRAAREALPIGVLLDGCCITLLVHLFFGLSRRRDPRRGSA